MRNTKRTGDVSDDANVAGAGRSALKCDAVLGINNQLVRSARPQSRHQHAAHVVHPPSLSLIVSPFTLVVIILDFIRSTVMLTAV